MTDLAQQLAEFEGRGCVVAPAGFGKTHAIASAVARCHRRQLLLTHTYAGVNALRRKLRESKVPSSLFYVTTIASFALRLCRAYPLRSKYRGTQPSSSAQWIKLYESCAALLKESFSGRIMRASFGGAFVDEYQDCSQEQHKLVLAIADSIPCRVFGDPLQAIFDFNGQSTIDWEADVSSCFETIGTLDTPHRWIRANAPELGAWLANARQRLEAGEPIDLSASLPTQVVYVSTAATESAIQTRVNQCRSHKAPKDHTVVALFGGHVKSNNRCHAIARNLSGQYSSIEEIEGKRVFAFLRSLTKANTPSAKLKAAIKFAAGCFTGVNRELAAATRKGEAAKITKATKNPVLTNAANSFLAFPTSGSALSFLLALRAVLGVPFCGDLFNRVVGALRKHVLNPTWSLDEAGHRYHGEFRHVGRPVGHRRIVATPLLVKGLEFDHAIVLDASELPRKQLYVAMTRGARTLVILSSTPQLKPAD